MSFPFPRDLPDPGIKSTYPALQVDSLPLSHQGSHCFWVLREKSLLNFWYSDHHFCHIHTESVQTFCEGDSYSLTCQMLHFQEPDPLTSTLASICTMWVVWLTARGSNLIQITGVTLWATVIPGMLYIIWAHTECQINMMKIQDTFSCSWTFYLSQNFDT